MKNFLLVEILLPLVLVLAGFTLVWLAGTTIWFMPILFLVIFNVIVLYGRKQK